MGLWLVLSGSKEKPGKPFRGLRQRSGKSCGRPARLWSAVGCPEISNCICSWAGCGQVSRSPRLCTFWPEQQEGQVCCPLGWGSLLWGEGEQERGFECSELGGPSDTMWRPRRDPRSPQPLGWILCGYGTEAPRKGVWPGRSSEAGGAPALRVGCRPDWGFPTYLVKQNKTGPFPSFHLGNFSSSSRPSSFARPLLSQLSVLSERSRLLPATALWKCAEGEAELC